MSRRSFTRTVIGALFGSAVACSLPLATASATDTINFGTQPATMPIYIAREMGLLDKIEKKHDVKIEFKVFSYGAPENQALAAGELQIASAGMGPAIVAAARLPAKLLAISILEQTAIIIPADSGIKTVAELKGKKIAFPGKGSQQYPLLVKALADAGLSLDDVQLFKTKGSDVPTLLANKSVDAGITWDPHVSNALAAGTSKVLLKAEKILPIKAGHYIGNGVYAREDFIAARPELVQDLIGSIVEAIDFILANEEAAVKMWAKQIGFPEEVIRFALAEKISVYNRDVAPEASTIEAYTKFLKDADILKPDDNPKFDDSFAKKALAPK
ncbi:aliphatic sulfonate ABC transporter substrate-binding protein [Alphaproteobacteria bacterium HT1-32]|nr:aliphatic sulfonate ABC transporter substrate-binding protein [Alphaproteobacteria bacterium HT1-32]